MKGHHNKYTGRTNMIIQAGVHRLTTPLKGTYGHVMMKSESFSSNLNLLEMITGGFSKLSLPTGNLQTILILGSMQISRTNSFCIDDAKY